MQWDKCRAVLVAEMDRQGINRAELVRRASAHGLKSSTVYGALWPTTIGQPYWGTVVGLLAALGKSLTWFDQRIRAGDPAEPGQPDPLPAPPPAKKKKAKVKA